MTHDIFERTPPHSIDAERAVLGSVLLNPDAVLDAAEIFGDSAPFYLRSHGYIWDAYLALMHAEQPVDVVTLLARLESTGKTDAVGGAVYLAELTEAVPTSANVARYAEIVRQKHMLRETIQTCTRAVDEAYGPQDDAQGWLDSLEAQIFALAENRPRAARVPIGSTAPARADVLRGILQGDKAGGLMLGVRDLDDVLYGLDPGDLAILAARPSVGKTALALNIAYNVARAGVGVLFFSCEMGLEALTQRLIGIAGGVDTKAIERRRIIQVTALDGLKRAVDRLRGCPLTMVDVPGLSTLELRADVRRHIAQQPDTGLIIVDYLQLMTAPRKRDTARHEEVAEISRSLKATAKEAGLPILALAQLNRMGGEGRPRLQHLRESGAIEQDADVVILMSEDESVSREGDNRTVIVEVAKHRNGATGELRLLFERRYQTFRALARDGDDSGEAAPACVPEQRAFDADFNVDNYAEEEDPEFEEEGVEEDTEAPF